MDMEAAELDNRTGVSYSIACYTITYIHRCGDCPAGYTGDGKTCSDIDECEEEESCDHTCVNSPGSFVCTCMSGYDLQDDGSSCVGK